VLRRLYDWTLSLASTQNALWALFGVAFVESSVFPIPPDVLMIPMILAARNRAWQAATVALIGSVLGALLGYFIGAVLFQSVGEPVLHFYGLSAQARAFSARFNAYGAWAVLIAGVTPFPFKVITIISGWTGLSLPVFIISAIVARGLRFFVVAALLWRFGAPIRDLLERRLGAIFSVFIVLLIGSFYFVRYL